MQSVVAAAKLGADVVYLNTGFAAPQLADVVAHEGIDAILHDDAFAPIVDGCGATTTVSGSELATFAEQRSPVPFPPTRHIGRQVILTSGTTGRPKGAARGSGGSLGSLTPLLEVVPIRARSTVVIAAPLFHAWGLVHMGVGLGMSSTAVVQSQFDPEATLAAIDEHRADGLVVVPVMLQRILALGGETLARYDTSSLRYIASSGSALGASLATATLRRFGPILYNIYGSTEVSLASIAGPGDLQAAPSTAGKVAPGQHGADPRRRRPSRCRPAASGASSSAAAPASTATRAVAARSRSTGCCRAATSGTSTPTAACSSTAATTT